MVSFESKLSRSIDEGGGDNAKQSEQARIRLKLEFKKFGCTYNVHLNSTQYAFHSAEQHCSAKAKNAIGVLV